VGWQCGKLQEVPFSQASRGATGSLTNEAARCCRKSLGNGFFDACEVDGGSGKFPMFELRP